jgi:glutaredoxin
MITLFSKDNCSQCSRAEQLLAADGKLFRVKKLGVDFVLEDILDMFNAAGLPRPRSFPIITKGSNIVGDLAALTEAIAEGTLDE